KLERLRMQPEYLIDDNRRRNLLRNASFESDTTDPWQLTSWLKNEQAAGLDSSQHYHGKQSLRLKSTRGDAVQFSQRVKVKPFTNYLFSGWINVDNMQIVEAGGTLGANLRVTSSREHSRSIEGTADWKYVVVMFYSGER